MATMFGDYNDREEDAVDDDDDYVGSIDIGVECEEFDKSFASFKKCYLKALARDVIALHLHVQLHELPINNITTNAQLFQKGNGYRPFLYNTTMNLCEFFKHPKRFMFWKIIYDNFKPYSNVNHTCPYDHDIIIDNITLNAEMMRLVPFPENDYMIQLQFAAYNVYRAKVKVYARIF
uniref:Uncharacterized protein n=1 Tax=Stomoxys calcitrans TaxID=35570 RepID=A0A1I8P0L9_STOCA